MPPIRAQSIRPARIDLPRSQDCHILESAPTKRVSSVRVARVEFTTPNLLTLFRIATVPVLVWLLTYIGPIPSAIAAGVFFLATITDYFDGYIARSYNSVTALGKFLDPLADKLIVIAALIMLAGMDRVPHVPAWMVVVLVSREVVVTGLRAVAAVEGMVLGAEELGKYKMSLQAIALHGLLIHYTYFHVDCFAFGMFVLWIAMVVSVWSAADYFAKVIRAITPRSTRSSGKRAAM
jgi:CDP-diacylglycerol--glycerol-3-phosphate 3-phosphatidyltransferase